MAEVIPIPVTEWERMRRHHEDADRKMEFMSKQLDLLTNYMQQVSLMLGVRGRIEELEKTARDLEEEKKDVFSSR